MINSNVYQVFFSCQEGSNDIIDLKRTRTSMWNKDYIQFLIERVWKITEPVDVLDCGCGYGFLGPMLLAVLPKGSIYTGVDLSYFCYYVVI